jgi:8-oxo-dGTP diphosphatase
MTEYRYTHPHPAVTVDVVIFTIRDRQLKLLLIRRGADPHRGKWALPGGFVQMDESLDEAARRELEEETGVTGVFLEQLYTFGEPKRDPRERVITVAHYALIPSDKLQLRAATDAEAVGWFALDDLPPLAFDHAEIVKVAHQRLVGKLDYSTIALAFMPKRFTLSELQEVYETIRREDIDKRNFRKWVLALGHVEETTEERRGGVHRPARLFRAKHPGRVSIIK